MCSDESTGHTELEAETFKAMWELSAPGGAAEHCFRRMKETEYYRSKVDLEVDWMPDVSSRLMPRLQTHGMLSSELVQAVATRHGELTASGGPVRIFLHHVQP